MVEVLEGFGYIVLTSGTILDQLGTRLCMLRPDLFELNPLTRWLIDHGLWVPFDITVVSLLIVPLAILLQEKRMKYRKAVMTIPLVVGLMKVVAGLYNLFLLR